MKKSIAIALLFLVALAGCSSLEVKMTTLDSQQAHSTFISSSDIVLVDVRTVAEFKEGHIKDSVNVPLDQLKTNIASVVENKDTPIYVVCRSGNRSAQAQSMLQAMGYTQVIDIGSVFDWPDPLSTSQ